MRPLTTGEEDVLLADDFRVGLKVEVEASSSTSVYNTLTAYNSKNWVDSVTIADSVDQLTARCDLSFVREQSSSQSICPLSSGSTSNQSNLSTFAPAIDVNREVKVYAATVPTSCSVGSTDYNMIFRGTIDEWDARSDPMQVSARDPGGYLMDRWIEADKAYPLTTDSSSIALEGVMQDIVWDHASTSITLGTTGATSFVVTAYNQTKMPVLQALQTMADLIGYTVRYYWSTASGDYTLQLRDPQRASTTPDSTFGPSRYETIPRLQLSRENIRNVVEVAYVSTAGVPGSVSASDTSSIDKYGRRWMRIQLAADAAINTSSEANTMASAALADLALPEVEQSADMHLYWPVELNDLYNWQANDRHYDTTQLLASVGFRHELSRNRHRTMIDCRGQPRSATRRWIDDSTSNEPGPTITVMEYRPGSTGNAIISVTATPGANAIFVTVSTAEPAAPTTSANNGSISGYVGEVTSTVNIVPGDPVHMKAVGQSLDGTLGAVAYKVAERPNLDPAINLTAIQVYLVGVTSDYSTGANYEVTWTYNAAVTTDMTLAIDHYRYSTSSTETASFKGSDTVTDATTGINVFHDADGSTTDATFYAMASLKSSGGSVLQTVRSRDIAGVDYS